MKVVIGEAYGNIELFRERTRSVMKKLFVLLPDYLLLSV